jgi:putative ABC transport system permease protein
LLKAGVTVDQARAEMEAIGRRIANDYAKSNKGWGVRTTLYSATLVWNDLRQSLYLLMAAAGMMLLIACANLANLVLARGLVRAREVAIRAALGAGRGRLVRQFLTESLLLSCAGGALGLLVAFGGMAVLKKAPPGGGLPLTAQVAMDGRVLLLALGLSLLTGVVFGLIPAIKASRLNLTHAFKDGSAATGTSRRLRGLSGALVVTEVALAFVLLSAAGLLVRSFFQMQKIELGFDITNLAVNYVPLGKRFSSANELRLYLHQIVDRIGALPGVRGAALTTSPPIRGGWNIEMQFQIAGAKGIDLARRPFCGFKVVTPSYFRTLGMRLIKGRFLNDHDGTGAPPVAVISESMAKKYLPDGDAVGRYVLVQELPYDSSPRGPEIPWEVVGVVKDEKNGLRIEDFPGIYVAEDQSPQTCQFVIVRGAMDPAVLDRSMRIALREINRDQVLDNLVTFAQVKSGSMASDERRSWVMAIFAAVALLLAGMGLYGVISHLVTQRTREIGVRTALGATSANIFGLILRNGMTLTCIGLVIGMAGALGLSQFLASMLFNVGKYDPVTLLAVGGVLSFTALLACYIPARRAMKVNPIVALRCE